MTTANGKGREFDGRQFTDSWGDVWTVTPCDVTPGDVSIRVDTPEGPVTVSIPGEDVGQLASRLTAAAMVAGRRALEATARAARPTCDGTCGDCSDADADAADGHAAHAGQVVS